MKKMLGAAASLYFLLGGAALAATPATAELATAIAAPKAVVAGGVVWRCAESTCRQTSSGSISSASACRELSRKVGPIAQLSMGEKTLDEEALARCNNRK